MVACLLFEEKGTEGNFILSPGGAFWPVFLIANIAALIASRAMTTATFSCVKQSTALGCFPRLKIIHTSRKFMGQIYIPVINWFLLVVCLVLVIFISNVNEIGNAYGKLLSNLPFIHNRSIYIYIYIYAGVFIFCSILFCISERSQFVNTWFPSFVLTSVEICIGIW